MMERNPNLSNSEWYFKILKKSMFHTETVYIYMFKINQDAKFQSWSEITVLLLKLGIYMYGHKVVILHSAKVTFFIVFQRPADRILGPWIT
jgi:hypothetical protein